MEEVERSLATIEKNDLERLAELAKEDRAEFFARHPKWQRLYSDRIFCVALCQGAALHYVDGNSGVKDFDVWTFYAEHPGAPFPWRRKGERDFGTSKFGRNPEDKGYIGRRVDLLGRSIRCSAETDPILTIQAYLSERGTRTSRKLSQKAVVLIEPSNLRGTIIWNNGPVKHSKTD